MNQQSNFGGDANVRQRQLSMKQLRDTIMTCHDPRIVMDCFEEYLKRGCQLSPEVRAKSLKAFKKEYLQLDIDSILRLLQALNPGTAIQLGGTGTGEQTLRQSSVQDIRNTNNSSVGKISIYLSPADLASSAMLFNFILGAMTGAIAYALYLQFLANQDIMNVNADEKTHRDWLESFMKFGYTLLPAFLKDGASFTASYFGFNWL